MTYRTVGHSMLRLPAVLIKIKREIDLVEEEHDSGHEEIERSGDESEDEEPRIKDVLSHLYREVWERRASDLLHSMAASSLRADEIKLWLTPSAKQSRNPCSCSVYPDLSTRHGWPVKKGLIRLKGNSKRTSGHSLSPLEIQNKDLCAASQTVLVRV